MPLVYDTPKKSSVVGNLSHEFPDPSREIVPLMVLALEGEWHRFSANSVNVSTVICPASPSPINSKAAFPEIVHD
jgi:hypothetical protein